MYTALVLALGYRQRDFLTLSWGPIVYRTSYAPETKRLLPVFMRYLNSSVARAR
jgi:hypothetical protein